MITVWKRGDLVRLKSGGPTMTVTHVPPYDENLIQAGVGVSWFDQGELCDAHIDSEALMRVNKSAKK